jgi:arginyl-tRNA synthetase
MSLLTAIRDLFEPFLADLSPDRAKVADYLAMVKPAANPDHGDYQANFAMALAKALGQKPPELAKAIVAKLAANDLIESATVAGPGFINVKLKPSFLTARVAAMAKDDRLGVEAVVKPKTFVIDLSGPNVAKPLHVGHLRSTIIGDALVRVLRFCGHTVVSDNHLGDWGTQFGMLIYGYRTFLDKNAYAGSNTNKVRELARLYVLVRNVAGTVDIISNAFTNFRDQTAFDANPVAELSRLYVNGVKRAKSGDEDDEERQGPPFPNPVAEAYRAETAKLHAGDPENLKLWKEFMPACMEEIHKVYEQLDILPIDHELGESFYQPQLAGIVEALQAKGVSETGEGGSIIIRFGENNVALIRKRDGAFTYTTTDLATIKHRVETWKPDTILYVVDFRQGQHFKNLFTAATRWGYDEVAFNHVSFGSVLGKDGKPLKTRDGGVPELSGLLDRATELGGHLFELTHWRRAAQGHDVPDWESYSDEEKQSIAQAVGIGAVKYADLSQSRTSDYKFDFDKMLAMSGNTATYMQYAYARCRSIFRKGEVDEVAFRAKLPAVVITTPQERALVVQLLKLPEAIDAAATEYLPHYLTAYLWDLAKSYSTFFEACPVLKAETPELRDSRLVLVDLVARTIKLVLNLLGIRTVERM